MRFLRKKKASAQSQSPQVKVVDAQQQAHDALCQNEILEFTAHEKVTSGKSPAGKLEIELRTSTTCPGFERGTSVIALIYKIPNGIQRDNCGHPHPGVAYQGDTRTAYLPNNAQGRKLLTRFKYAWVTGHMLSIGRSQTHQRDNMTLWSTVPQKSSLQGGPFGFPDSNYIRKAHWELDKLNIPDHETCLEMLPLAKKAQYVHSRPSERSSSPPAAAELRGSSAQSTRTHSTVPSSDSTQHYSSTLYWPAKQSDDDKQGDVDDDNDKDEGPSSSSSSMPNGVAVSSSLLAPAVPVFCPCDATTTTNLVMPSAPPAILTTAPTMPPPVVSNTTNHQASIVPPSRLVDDPLMAGAAVSHSQKSSKAASRSSPPSSSLPSKLQALSSSTSSSSSGHDGGPLLATAATRHEKVETELLDEDGNTPLHLAVLRDRTLPAVNSMARRNPNFILVPNKDGQTPLDIALKENLSMEVIVCLIRARDKAVGEKRPMQSPEKLRVANYGRFNK